MKTLTVLGLIAVLAGVSPSYAQMSPLPPSSSADGVAIQDIGLDAGPTHWDNAAGVGAFKAAGTTNGTAPLTNIAYNPIGLPFGTAIPGAIQANLNTINTNGGIVRAVFLAESAGWLNSFGYTRSGNFMGPQSFTAFAQMQESVNPVNVHYGDHLDIDLAAGTAANFDFWFQGDGLSSAAGDYTLFKPANSMPDLPPGNVMWAQRALMVNTWIPSMGAYMAVPTYVLGLEDWRLDQGSDRDYSDGVFALQFFTSNGTPFAPVPEPTAYGVVGVIALLGLIILGRSKRYTPFGSAHRQVGG